MKAACKHLIRDEELTQELRKKFKTDDIYRFLTGKPDTVLEFCFNWTSMPQLMFQGRTLTTPEQAPPVQQPPEPQTPHPPPSSGSSSSSLPHLSLTPSTSGMRPNLMPQPSTPRTQPTQGPSGASTSGTQSTQPYPFHFWHTRCQKSQNTS